jgi:hypothetical protein
MHIDFTPLIPVINGLIVTVASVLAASTPVLVGYAVIWLRNHGIAVKAADQQNAISRINATIANGLNFATTEADVGVAKLNVDVADPKVAKAVNYVIAQSPDLLKKVGLDPATTEGQQALVRLVTAKSAAPVVPTINADVNVSGGKA